MIFGTIIKTYLDTWIAGAEGATLGEMRTTDGFKVHGPIALGPAAPGVHGEVWCNANATTSDAEPPTVTPSTTVVLGAGNQPFLAFIDVLECIFNHNETVMCAAACASTRPASRVPIMSGVALVRDGYAIGWIY
jgi:hypothetical protein